MPEQKGRLRLRSLLPFWANTTTSAQRIPAQYQQTAPVQRSRPLLPSQPQAPTGGRGQPTQPSRTNIQTTTPLANQSQEATRKPSQRSPPEPNAQSQPATKMASQPPTSPAQTSQSQQPTVKSQPPSPSPAVSKPQTASRATSKPPSLSREATQSQPTTRLPSPSPSRTASQPKVEIKPATPSPISSQSPQATRTASRPPSPRHTTSQPPSPSRAVSQSQTATRTVSQPPSPSRKVSQSKTATRAASQPAPPSRKASQSQPETPRASQPQSRTASRPISPSQVTSPQPTHQEDSQLSSPSTISHKPESPSSPARKSQPRPMSPKTVQPQPSLSQSPPKDIETIAWDSSEGTLQQQKDVAPTGPKGYSSKTVSSTNKKGRQKESETRLKASTLAGEEAAMQKELREGVSRYVHKVAIGTALQPGDEHPLVSVTTLAGENRGASMSAGPNALNRESYIHIHRGYKLNKDDETEVTSEREGSCKEQLDRQRGRLRTTCTCINNNMQSINNSFLINSSCSERNPGVHLVLSNPAEAKKPKEKMESFEAQKTKFRITPVQNVASEPTVRRRCLRGLFMEPSDSDPDNPQKPRRHGCRYSCPDRI